MLDEPRSVLAASPNPFGPIRLADGLIRASYRNPRHARALDLVMLTDLRGIVLDIATPGLRSARALRRRKRRHRAPWRRSSPRPARDELVFSAADAPEGFYLYVLSTGAYALGGRAPQPHDLPGFIARIDAPFLIPSRHPPCAPDEARALDLPTEEAVAALYRDVLQRGGDTGGIEAYARKVRARRRSLAEIAIDLACSDEMTESVFGGKPAPAVSQFRRRALFEPHVFARPTPSARVATPEAAFAALGRRFDPKIWSRDWFQRALWSADGDLNRFASGSALALVTR
ncbi:MAG: hypothetical protein AAFW46_07980 [Pseudomonadota bacterium]